MTRINVVPPSELCDKHLLAEYRDLPRVFALARPCLDAPKEYVLGKGHVKFFYDKLAYLNNRFILLYNECINRGFKVQYSSISNEYVKDCRVDWFNDYTPTPEALAINRSRINERLATMKNRQSGKREIMEALKNIASEKQIPLHMMIGTKKPKQNRGMK